MAYKRYIKKNGKVYGPYIYHSRKENGKVISEYQGKGRSSVKDKLPKFTRSLPKANKTLPKVNKKLFEIPDDFRLAEVIRGLDRLRETDADLYGVIAQIDFSDKVFLEMRTTISRSLFRMRSHRFYDQLQRLKQVCLHEEWNNHYVYDLTYDDFVIRQN